MNAFKVAALMLHLYEILTYGLLSILTLEKVISNKPNDSDKFSIKLIVRKTKTYFKNLEWQLAQN